MLVSSFRLLTVYSCFLLQWLTEHKADSDAAHDLSVGLRDNYRARWKTAINAVRASTKFRTFAALAADGKEEDENEDGKEAKFTKGELYSDSSPEPEDASSGHQSGDEEDKPKKLEREPSVSKLAEMLSVNKVK